MTYFPSLPGGSLIHFIMKYPQYSKPLHEFLEATLRASNGELTPAERETIFAYVSGVNGCRFCADVHTGVAEGLGFAEGAIHDFLEDRSFSSASAKMRPILAYVTKLTEDPASVGKEDVQAILDAGWSEDTVMNIVMVCCAANFFNRWVEGCGVEPEPNMVKAGIKALVEGGYTGVHGGKGAETQLKAKTA